MFYKVQYDKVLARKHKGLSVSESLWFDGEKDASNWIAAMKMIDKDRNFTNFRISKVS
jgi:hypothetical protein